MSGTRALKVFSLSRWVVEPPWLPWIFNQIEVFEISDGSSCLEAFIIQPLSSSSDNSCKCLRGGANFPADGLVVHASIHTHIQDQHQVFPAEHCIVTSCFMSFISPVSPLNVLTDRSSKCSYRYGFLKVMPSWRGQGEAAAIPFIWSKSFFLRGHFDLSWHEMHWGTQTFNYLHQFYTLLCLQVLRKNHKICE